MRNILQSEETEERKTWKSDEDNQCGLKSAVLGQTTYLHP